MGRVNRHSLTPSILIVQEYVPKYREPFFEGLINTLAEDGISCKVTSSKPSGIQSKRGDSVHAEWIIPYTQLRAKLGGRTFVLGGSRKYWAPYDGIIVGHLGSSLETYRAIFDGIRGKVKVGLWGHIKSYVNDGNPIDLALERWQLRHVNHVFAYTEGGRGYALAAGTPYDRVTAVMNAIDTSALVRAREHLSDVETRLFTSRHGLVEGKTLGYIGGLDKSKRVDFLAIALDRLWAYDPEIRVLVGGKGSEEELLRSAIERGQAIMLGYINEDLKALIARTASALINPGRIGLVAVDALALNIPIVTTRWRYHAPEVEYLKEGVTKITSDDTPDLFADKIIDVLQRRDAWEKSVSSSDWSYPTLETMVTNFSSGVKKMLVDE